MASKHAPNSYFFAFSNALVWAHNICSLLVNWSRNLKDKIKDIEEFAQFLRFGSFQVRKYYYFAYV